MTTCWQHPIVYQPIQFSDAGAAEKFEPVGYKREGSPSSSRLSPVPLLVNSLSPVLPTLDVHVTDRRGTARSLHVLFFILTWNFCGIQNNMGNHRANTFLFYDPRSVPSNQLFTWWVKTTCSNQNFGLSKAQAIIFLRNFLGTESILGDPGAVSWGERK